MMHEAWLVRFAAGKAAQAGSRHFIKSERAAGGSIAVT
jgi:hypothetical protein